MSERRPDGAFAVAPRRLGGGGGRDRRRRVLAGIALLAGVTLVGIGWVGPRLSERPSLDVAYFATPTPRSTPSALASSSPTPFHPVGATPLPALTRAGGVTIDGRILVFSDAFRVLDLATGLVVPSVQLDPSRDALVRAADGDGWTCVCTTDRYDQGSTRDVDVVRIDRDGRERSRTRVGSFGPGSDPNLQIQTDIDLAPDGRSGVIVAVVPGTTEWSYSVASIDLVRPKLGPALDLGRQKVPELPTPLPSFDPAEGGPYVYSYGPFIRRSPDGTVAFVWSSLQKAAPDGSAAPPTTSAWRVTINGGEPVSATEAPALAGLVNTCGSIGWLTAKTVVASCAGDPTVMGIATSWGIITLDATGAIRRRIALPEPKGFYSEPLLDGANDAVWLWDPTFLTLLRTDARTAEITTTVYDPRAQAAEGGAAVGAATPAWRHASSSTNSFAPRQIDGAPDGSRIYAIGFKSEVAGGQPFASVGVFVIDPTTRALLQRWDPDVLYAGLQPVLDGRVVALAGSPGVDASGKEAPWQGSLTIRDAADGRIIERFGQLGEGTQPFVVGR